MTQGAWSSRRPTSRGLLLGGIGLAVAVLLISLGAVTIAWGDSLHAQGRLLPGTQVGGVDVGGGTVADAVAAVEAEIALDLDREVVLAHGDRSWTTSARRLGATADVEQTVAAAFEHTTTAGLFDLARHRVAGSGHGNHGIELDVPDDAVAAYVAGVADDVDTPPQDAVVTWTDGEAVVEDAVVGARVQQDEAADRLVAAIADGDRRVELPVDEEAPDVGTDQADELAGEVSRLVATALDHEVTVVLEDTTRTVTPRELDAAYNAQALIADGDPTPADVEVEVTDTALDALVDEVAAGHERAARDATLSWSAGGGFSATPSDTGLSVDHEDARGELRSALAGATDRVELQLHTTQPRITTDRFGEVLLVRQDERRVDLYRGGEVVRSWDVAVGTGDHPTPTGMFTIGAKRYEPTWVNPSPDSWGDTMPARIGPGPNNPLGLRALNWHRDGVDTLIRFHGTANEDSIGRAASHGCVRMRNADVIELYDLVSTGTVIVSVT